MSAFLCSDAHISALVNAAEFYRVDLPREHDPESLFHMLVTENYRSLAARYQDKPGDPSAHRYTLRPPLPALAVIKLAQSYEYQSCEHDGWDASVAKGWIERLIAGLIFRIPGYDAAPWSI